MTSPDFSIITPCYNASHLISETIDSILNQSVFLSKSATFEYIVVDGLSSDDTISIVSSYDIPCAYIISESDTGMYHALAKGLRRASGNICFYINAGDVLHPKALEIVLEIFANENVNWITGYKSVINEKSQVVSCRTPYLYDQKLVTYGCYGRQLPYIQQESTFWRRKLNELIDLDELLTFKLAGDAYIWHRFSKSTNLYSVEAVLGNFRVHKGQLSSSKTTYTKEITKFAKTPLHLWLKIFFHQVTWLAPAFMQRLMNRQQTFYFDHQNGAWRKRNFRDCIRY